MKPFYFLGYEICEVYCGVKTVIKEVGYIVCYN
jgi:hypothetical protein